MALSKYYVSVRGQDKDQIHLAHIRIVKLPIKALNSSGNEKSRSWGFSFRGDRELAIDILKECGFVFSLSEPFS